MPNFDDDHDIAKQALINDGWSIDGEQVVFLGSERHIVIDLQASKEGQGIILVEVKGFRPSMVEALANTIGKIQIYRYILDELKINIPIWIAVPEAAFEGILTEQMGKVLRQQFKLDLVVFSVEQEAIVGWIPHEKS